MSRIGEGRNGGGAGAWAVGLAEEWDGRADNGTVQNKLRIKYQEIVQNIVLLLIFFAFWKYGFDKIIFGI